MKSYTDIEQSKKLAKILPTESADMHYSTWVISNGEFIVSPNYGNTIENMQEDYGNQIIPCWSLAALLGVIPNFPALTQEDVNKWEICVRDYNNDEYIEITTDNPVDACYEMIIKLHEQKLL